MGSLHGTSVAEIHGIRRSPHWSTVEKHFLASNSHCFVCSIDQEKARQAQGGLPTHGLQVHHVFPFHFCILLGRPDLEVDPRNLVVLCEDEKGVVTQDHHNLVGHLRNFQSYCPDLVNLIARSRGMSKEALLALTWFQSLCSSIPPTWGAMTNDQKDRMRAMLDAVFPLDLVNGRQESGGHPGGHPSGLHHLRLHVLPREQWELRF